MESKYKVGDIVTVKKNREGRSSDYLFSFTDEMVKKHGGKSYRIKEVTHWEDTPSGRVMLSDGYLYKLEGADFNWSSSMFEDPNDSTSSSNTDSISAFIRKKKCPELDFSL